MKKISKIISYKLHSDTILFDMLKHVDNFNIALQALSKKKKSSLVRLTIP